MREIAVPWVSNAQNSKFEDPWIQILPTSLSPPPPICTLTKIILKTPRNQNVSLPARYHYICILSFSILSLLLLSSSPLRLQHLVTLGLRKWPPPLLLFLFLFPHSSCFGLIFHRLWQRRRGGGGLRGLLVGREGGLGGMGGWGVRFCWPPPPRRMERGKNTIPLFAFPGFPSFLLSLIFSLFPFSFAASRSHFWPQRRRFISRKEAGKKFCFFLLRFLP